MNLFVRFIATGATGALLSLLITWALTTYVVGTVNYFSAYLVGIAANLFFNFIIYTRAVFKTKHDHVRRLLIFLFYGVIMAFLQGATVRLITSIVGEARYLVVIAGVIALFAILNFFVFKLSIFREYPEGIRASMKAKLSFVVLCAVLLRVAVLFHVLAIAGIAPLVYGDALSYRQLATSLADGAGFVRPDMNGVVRDEVFRTPGLPLLLAAFAGSDGGLSVYFFLLAVISGTLLPVLVYGVGKRFISADAAFIAALFIAFEPHLVFFSILPQTEMPFILFSYGGFLAIMYAIERRLYVFAALAGALLAYASLIRPGFWPVFVVAAGGTLLYLGIRRRRAWRYVSVMLALALIFMAPWYMRVHEVSGVYALSGAGWRNVYTDYLASIRAVEKGTGFAVEKRALKDNAELAGVPTDEVDNPASAKKLRDFALAEMWVHKETVIKLEATLLTSFFFQDGYYYQMKRFFLLPLDKDTHQSPTFLLLSKGFGGIPEIFNELARQRFVPIVGRAFTLLTFIGALLGFFLVRNPIRYLFALIIALSALTATVIGLGVESRLRLPVEPLLFIFLAAAIVWVADRLTRLHAR